MKNEKNIFTPTIGVRKTAKQNVLGPKKIAATKVKFFS